MPISAEVLARLAPKISQLDRPGGTVGTKDVSSLQPLDYAAALAGLPRGPYYLARVTWIDDRADWNKLVGQVQERLQVDSDWHNVIAFAVAEYCWPPGCRSCAGRGEIRKQDYYGKCVRCEGSGYGRLPERRLAEACGIEAKEWKRVWARRYERVYRLVAGWGSEALSHLARRLGE